MKISLCKFQKTDYIKKNFLEILQILSSSEIQMYLFLLKGESTLDHFSW